MTACSVILDDVAVTLGDDDMVDYTMSHLLGALNNACRVIASLRADAAAVNAVVQLQAGTRQTLPSGGQQFIGSTRNFLSPTTPGRAVQIKTVVDKNRIAPDWHTEPPESEVLEVMPDPNDPRVFWNYPPVTGGCRLEIQYSGTPPEITSVEAEFPLLSKYLAPAKHWVLFEMFSRDSNSAGHVAKAGMHRELVFQLLGISSQADGAARPKAAV